MKVRNIIKTTTILLVSASVITGCGNKETEIKPTSLFDAIRLMTSTKNYTVQEFAEDDLFNTYVVSEYAIGRYNKRVAENTDFYVVSGKGLYEVTYDDQYRKSEYILDEDGSYITDLWNNNIVKTLHGIDPEDVVSNKEATEANIKNRDFKLGFLGTIGIQSTRYADLEYIKASFDGSLELELKFFDENTPRNYEVGKFGTSSIAYAQSLVNKNVGAFVPDENLENMRALIKGDNYKIQSYDVVEENFYAQEWINPNYWFTTRGNYGYAALNHKADPADETDVDVKGCYMFQVSDGKLQFYPNALSDVTSIAEFENYPSRMKTLKNMQYINAGMYEDLTDYEYSGDPYYVTNMTYVYDILDAFSVNPKKAAAESIFSHATPKAVVMDIYIDPHYRIGDTSSEKSMITYIYMFEYNKKTYQMYLPMVSFGGANITSLDTYLETFNNVK